MYISICITVPSLVCAARAIYVCVSICLANNKLRKRVLAEDCDLAAVIKLGLAMEHSESKAGRLGPKMRQTVRCGGCRNWRGRLRD